MKTALTETMNHHDLVGLAKSARIYGIGIELIGFVNQPIIVSMTYCWNG